MTDPIVKTPDNDTFREWLKALNLLEQDALSTWNYDDAMDAPRLREELDHAPYWLEEQVKQGQFEDDMETVNYRSEYLIKIANTRVAIEALMGDES